MRKVVIFLLFLVSLVIFSSESQAQVFRRGRVGPLARVRAAVRAFVAPRRGVVQRQVIVPRRQFVNPRRGFVRGRHF